MYIFLDSTLACKCLDDIFPNTEKWESCNKYTTINIEYLSKVAGAGKARDTFCEAADKNLIGSLSAHYRYKTKECFAFLHEDISPQF